MLRTSICRKICFDKIYLEKNPAAYYSINIEKKIYKFIKGGWL